MSEEGRQQGSTGGKLQVRYPEESPGRYTVYSQTIPHCYFVITHENSEQVQIINSVYCLSVDDMILCDGNYGLGA